MRENVGSLRDGHDASELSVRGGDDDADEMCCYGDGAPVIVWLMSFFSPPMSIRAFHITSTRRTSDDLSVTAESVRSVVNRLYTQSLSIKRTEAVPSINSSIGMHIKNSRPPVTE